MRLVRRWDNLNKKTLIYISYTSCHHKLRAYNPSCSQNNEIKEQHKQVPWSLSCTELMQASK